MRLGPQSIVHFERRKVAGPASKTEPAVTPAAFVFFLSKTYVKFERNRAEMIFGEQKGLRGPNDASENTLQKADEEAPCIFVSLYLCISCSFRHRRQPHGSLLIPNEFLEKI